MRRSSSRRGRSRVVNEDGFWVFDTRYNFAAETKSMTELEFQKMFRLPRAAFNEILSDISLDLAPSRNCFASRHPT